MPILQQVTRIQWTPKNKEYYEEKGYTFTEFRDSFKVLVKDLFPETTHEVIIQCDFCKKILKKPYCRCIDICNCNDKECIQKRKELTNLKKYGVKYVFQAKSVKQKIIDIIKQKYGVDKVSDIPGIYEKIQATSKKHNYIPTSKQQKRLHKLFGGVMNYVYDSLAIDIALIDEKIAIEYNGSGHDLNVQKNRITEEEFIDHENERKNFLLNNGWKLLILISKDDNISNNFVLRKLFNFAKHKFYNNINYIEIDFDKGQVYFDDYIISIREAIKKV